MNEEAKVEEQKKEENEQTQAQDKKPKKDKTVKVKESELNGLKEELAQIKDKHVRLYAEFENMRKRMDREKQEFVKYANEGLMLEVLTILDSLELSLKSACEKEHTDAALIKGIELVLSQMKDLLKRNNVRVMESVGKPFDHNCHEVLMQEESDEAEGTVLEDFQKGYYFGERVLRTAKVKISKAKEAKEETKEEAQD